MNGMKPVCTPKQTAVKPAASKQAFDSNHQEKEMQSIQKNRLLDSILCLFLQCLDLFGLFQKEVLSLPSLLTAEMKNALLLSILEPQ